MPRMMSFALTTAQFEDGTKTVTRRKKWLHLKPGDLFIGIEKGMGLKKGEKVRRLKRPLRRCVSNTRERLDTITPEEVAREGFPGKSPEWFVGLYCRANGGDGSQDTSRIEFEEVTP